MRPTGIEPATSGSGGQRSIQLSYGREMKPRVRRDSSNVNPVQPLSNATVAKTHSPFNVGGRQTMNGIPVAANWREESLALAAIGAHSRLENSEKLTFYISWLKSETGE